MAVTLYSYQEEAVQRLKSGCILCGGVGSGKSITALAYFFSKECGGNYSSENWSPMTNPKDLYIITTARKRDTHEWEPECIRFVLPVYGDHSLYSTTVVIDSWNNIKKYISVKNAFFIFDEQRLVGSGEWVKSFYKIAAFNRWILLSATPGDTWMDYIPVFVANGFYKNRTDFKRQHVVEATYSRYFKVDHYLNEGKLIRIRRSILVDMDYTHKIDKHYSTIISEYDKTAYRTIMVERWNIYDNIPIENVSKMCYLLRRVSNSHESRLAAVDDILKTHCKAIVFYNYDYELEALKSYRYSNPNLEIAEWSGHKHETIPSSSSWLYLVQYNAGAEGWNCLVANTIIFYSQSYSYKQTIQAAGRIDRLNTPFNDLYYYQIRSNSPIDLAISRSLSQKKNFNEKAFIGI